MPPPDPPQAEERGHLSVLFQQCQDAVCIAADSSFVAAPLRLGARGYIVQDVEPVFYVKREDIHCWHDDSQEHAL